MTDNRLRRLGFGFLATAGAGLFGLTSMTHAAFAYGETTLDNTEVHPDVGLVMGGSGTPLPNSDMPGYVGQADELFIHPNFPDTTYPGPYANGLFTPEGLYPSTGVNSLPLDTSVSEGVTILNSAIQSNLAAKDASTVFGYSQSTLISSQEMALLDPGKPSDLPVNFVLIGDELNPNGGALSRFDVPGDNTAVASLGINFYPATPADSFPTVIYTSEYDGFADFPQYPLNLLSDLNAELGILTIHDDYLSLTQLQVTPVADGGDAILLPGSKDYPGVTDSLTNYYLIPETPPLVSAINDIPVIGTPLAALLGPDLTFLINLGYGNPDYGYSAGPDGPLPANVPTTFGLFPDANPTTVMQDLITGAQQGFSAFESDISTEMSAISSGGLSSLLGSSSATSTTSLSDLFTALSTDLSSPAALSTTLTDIVNAFSAAASAAYGTLVPTADIVNALLTSLPLYDANVFLDNLGNPLDAVGLPIAANTGLLAVGAGLELEVLANAASAIASDFSGIIP